jgi:hypothetical protein
MLLHKAPEFVAHHFGVNIPLFDKAVDSRQLLWRKIIVRTHVAGMIAGCVSVFLIPEHARCVVAAKKPSSGQAYRVSLSGIGSMGLRATPCALQEPKRPIVATRVCRGAH